MMLGFGVFVSVTHGAPSRYTPQSVTIASYERIGGDKSALRAGQCFFEEPLIGAFSKGFNQQLCLPQSSTKPSYLIVGNSHAAHLWLGLSTVFTGINWQQMTGVGCLPNDEEALEGPSCKEMRDFLFDRYLPSHAIDTVILSSDWEPINSRKLGATLDQLRKFPVRVIVVGPIMRYDRPLPELLVEAVERGQNGAIFFRSHYETEVLTSERILREVIRDHPGVEYISLIDLLCPNQQCVTLTPDGIPLQSDDSHLTPPGSIYIAGRLRDLDMFNRPR